MTTCVIIFLSKFRKNLNSNKITKINDYRFGFRRCYGIVIIILIKSEYVDDKRIKKKLDSLLLNGNSITMIVPGAEPEADGTE